MRRGPLEAIRAREEDATQHFNTAAAAAAARFQIRLVASGTSLSAGQGRAAFLIFKQLLLPNSRAITGSDARN